MLLEGIVKMIIGKPEVEEQRKTLAFTTPAQLWEACHERKMHEAFSLSVFLPNKTPILGFERVQSGFNQQYIGWIGTASTDWVIIEPKTELIVIGVHKPQSKQ